jgi:hypothetical protein
MNIMNDIFSMEELDLIYLACSAYEDKLNSLMRELPSGEPIKAQMMAKSDKCQKLANKVADLQRNHQS